MCEEGSVSPTAASQSHGDSRHSQWAPCVGSVHLGHRLLPGVFSRRDAGERDLRLLSPSSEQNHRLVQMGRLGCSSGKRWVNSDDNILGILYL